MAGCHRMSPRQPDMERDKARFRAAAYQSQKKDQVAQARRDAAALLLAVGVPVRRMLTRPPTIAASAQEVATEFLPLLYSSVPATNMRMVRLAVPRAALASFGLTPLESLDRASTGTVLADVLVGDDGLARAVRFVRPATDQEHQQ